MAKHGNNYKDHQAEQNDEHFLQTMSITEATMALSMQNNYLKPQGSNHYYYDYQGAFIIRYEVHQSAGGNFSRFGRALVTDSGSD